MGRRLHFAVLIVAMLILLVSKKRAISFEPRIRFGFSATSVTPVDATFLKPPQTPVFDRRNGISITPFSAAFARLKPSAISQETFWSQEKP
jgi:hypothetical protein